MTHTRDTAAADHETFHSPPGDNAPPNGKLAAAASNPLISSTEKCKVCREPAAKHIHYGSVTCFSCRAFFRRSIQNQGTIKAAAISLKGAFFYVKSTLEGYKTRSGPKIPAVGPFGRGDILNSGKQVRRGISSSLD